MRNGGLPCSPCPALLSPNPALLSLPPPFPYEPRPSPSSPQQRAIHIERPAHIASVATTTMSSSLGRALVWTIARASTHRHGAAITAASAIALPCSRAFAPPSSPSSSSASTHDPDRWSCWSRAYAKKSGKKKGGGQRAAPSEVGGGDGDAGPTVDMADLARQRDAALASLRADLASLRPNRATNGMLDHITVDAYGSPTPLKHVAATAVRDTMVLAVTTFDATNAKAVLKAIGDSPMGLVARQSDGDPNEVLVSVLPPSDDTRRDMCKVVASMAEQRRVQLRDQRRKAIKAAKGMSDRDAGAAVLKEVEAFYTNAAGDVDALAKDKERDIMA